MKCFKTSLIWQILIALVLGTIVGTILHNQLRDCEWLITNVFSPAGDIFICLIKMIVTPIVVSTLIVGIAGVGDVKKLGRIGIRTIVYFEVITIIAIAVGIILANIFRPGIGIDMSTLTTADISRYEAATDHMKIGVNSPVIAMLALIPQNIFAAFAKGDMLPVIFFSVLFGLALSSLPHNHREPLIKILRSISETMFKMIHIIMYYAPIGVFSLIVVTITNFGFSSLWPLAKLVSLVYAAILFFVFVVLGSVARACKLQITILMRILKDELILAYFTSSSETVLSRIMEKMESYGVSKVVTGFVVPMGYSFNLDGSTLYQSITVIFIAQLYGINLSLTDEIILVLTLMVTSKGIAGVPGVSFIVLLATLESVGLPLEGLAFVAGVDRIMDMIRTALNVVGNALAVLVIAKWENQFDTTKARKYEQQYRE